MADDLAPGDAQPAIRNVVCILMDSLVRLRTGPYGGDVATPNLDRFARRTTRFTRHYAGSLPCMPARHDIATGTQDFLWKPWGSLECWEKPLPTTLRGAGIVTQLVTDHYHLFSPGGENYHVDYLGWEFERGHEGDLWATEPVDTSVGTPTIHVRDYIYARNRTRFADESDYPGAKTMAAAADWVDRNAGRHERFFLMVDEFDPHEPFDTPDPYRSMYDPTWQGPNLIWPPYTAGERLPERDATQLRAQYAGKVTMIDHWFGKLLDAFDRHDLWRDTLVILLTDHGLYLGEKDLWGKPGVELLEPMVHIPLLVHMPGREPGDCDALTTSVDVHSTILDVFGLEPDPRVVGRSLLPVLRDEVSQVRDYVLAGYFGHAPFVTDGEWSYQPRLDADASPLYAYSNRWSVPQWMRLPSLDKRAELDTFMPRVSAPVIRQPLDGWAPPNQSPRELLFNVADDPEQHRNLVASAPEVSRSRDLLVAALEEAEAPREVFARAGLTT
jgi:arylsulfatase A-like enzyme